MLGGAAGQSEPPTEGRGDTVGSLSFFFYGYLRLVGIGNGEINTCNDLGASEREYSGFSGSIACFGKREQRRSLFSPQRWAGNAMCRIPQRYTRGLTEKQSPG
jgi:hypothetical protein